MSFLKDAKMKSIAELAADRPHGDKLKYKAGCRCRPCTAAMCRYQTEREQAKRRGEWNGLVPATKARRHILKLSKQHVGYKAVADAAGVPRSSLAKIRAGKKTQIRASTERKILAVSAEARADASHVPAAKTWKLINRLLAEGFTKAELARRLGSKTPALQIRKDRILAKTAMKVEQLYRRVMQ